MAKIDYLFEQMLKCGGSDLHLSEGFRPKIREHGSIRELSDEKILTSAIMEDYLAEICPRDKWQKYKKTNDIDFAYAKDMNSRFRANYFRQIHGMGAVFRIIPNEILTIEQLNVPQVITSFAELTSGLVLVTGPTGSGKSTTLAAIINHINENYHRYILTIEEPIEFVHKNKKSIFCHREVGIHVNSFAEGLKVSTRQDLDVVLVGEMRDYETISLALTAASMGTLLFGTLHTNSAIKTINRIIDVFPSELQKQARGMLANSLKGVCAQLLMKRTDTGRVAVNEVLLDIQGLATSIRESNLSNIGNLMLSGKSMGMVTMDDSIKEKLDAGIVFAKEAYQKAENKEMFEAKLKQEESKK